MSLFPSVHLFIRRDALIALNLLPFVLSLENWFSTAAPSASKQITKSGRDNQQSGFTLHWGQHALPKGLQYGRFQRCLCIHCHCNPNSLLLAFWVWWHSLFEKTNLFFSFFNSLFPFSDAFFELVYVTF